MRMIKIPVNIRFDRQQVIGHMEVDVDQLPSTPNYHFALGYMEDASKPGYTLTEVGVVADSEFRPLQRPTLQL